MRIRLCFARRLLALVTAGVVAALAACGSDARLPGATSSTASGSGAGSGSGAAGTGGAGAAAGASASGAAAAGGAGAGPWSGPLEVAMSDRQLVCKLINGDSLESPSGNQTHTRFNLRGSDLGVPLLTNDHLVLLFGDTTGYKVIWPFGEDPDAMARIPRSAVEADIASLCTQLDFLVTPDVPSVAAGVDPSIQRDFAGAFVTPPEGASLADFIHQAPPGFPNIPGTFEVPAGVIRDGNQAVVFYASGAELEPRPRMTLSFVAGWLTPGTSVAPGLAIRYLLDRLEDGPLGGHFIQVAPLQDENWAYLFGTGDYRHSGIWLARKVVSDVDEAGGEELFDPALGTWTAASALSQSEREAIPPLLESDGVGELSVTPVILVPGDGEVVPHVYAFVMVYQRELHDADGNIVDNRIVARVAPTPAGPWSEPATIFDMADPAFQAAHCCGVTCPGEQILHCDKAGLYGAYVLPLVKVNELRSGLLELDVPFVVSTWDPYNVVLFRTRLALSPAR
jgi:hypothetical protein